MKMWVYVIRRVLLLIPVIIGVMTITFSLVYFLPVQDKLISLYGPSKVGYNPMVPCNQLGIPQSGNCVNPTYVRGYHALGLDQPVFVQWAKYIWNSLTLNWGSTDSGSFASHQLGFSGTLPITTALAYLLPYTLELAAISLFIILVLAIPIGNYSAVYRNRPIDQAARVLSFSGFALPGFLLATILLLGVSSAMGAGIHCNGTADSFDYWYGSWPSNTCFPPSNRYPSFIGTYLQTSPTGFPTVDAAIAGNWALAADSIRRMLLPAFVIAFGSIAAILRFVRNSMLEVMNLDFVRTARSKGVPERTVVSRHAGRNSLNVTVTVLGLTFAAFIGGFPIIEDVFHLRGVGLMLAYSIQRPFDYGLIFGVTLLFTIIVVIANIVVDILYAYLDPRVRLG
ncbi:MAG TPA: ABC transporter permease [Thermoplasmata archaeon]|nr:ABC transporter permease [Thermoplasmata archaeon]